jgi:hypothetical protein
VCKKSDISDSALEWLALAARSAIFAAKLFQALHAASSTQRGPILQKPQLTHHRDREWQKWPVTIVTGAYIGYAVGKLLGGTLLKGKKIMFD